MDKNHAANSTHILPFSSTHTKQNKSHTFYYEARVLYCLGLSLPDPVDVEEDSGEELVEDMTNIASAVTLPAGKHKYSSAVP